MTQEEKLWKTFNKALGQYQLIDEDDHILVALSGGKDSLCLLEFMARRQKVYVPRFTLEAVHVRMDNIHYETSTAYLQQFCDELQVPLHIVTTSFVPSDKKPPCFLCSWQRRKQLFKIAQEHGCTKIALGHHQDDIIHTALMNLMFQGHFSSMPAKLQMRKMPLSVIRPLCLCKEEDIRSYATLRQYQKPIKSCPYEHATQRDQAAALFESLESIHPEVRYSIIHALENRDNPSDY